MDKQKQIINFLKYLSLHGVSPKSLKYYKSDFISFLNWAGNKKINQSLILEYINSIRAVTPISTLKRRQSTLRSYASFMGFKKVSNTWQESILYAFTKKPRLQNFFHKLFFSRPNWYRTYHSYQLATYIHVAILVLFTSIAGFAVYDQIFNTKNNLLAFPTALTRPNRYLSFQGRLTSNVGNPITTATNLVFKLYDASTAGTELWTSGTCSITPDQDGIFSTLLGTTTNCPTATEIAATVFSENASVWVGVTVAADAEATPRVQIATVAYALNSETLQGYPAGTGTSTIPYIASTGTLVLANASPKIQSTSGTFAVEGLAMTITTPNASNGVITVNPDGVGTLNLTFEGAAAGLSANGFVNATNANITSGALYGGTVASAATGYNFIDFQSGVSPTSKFSVQDDGDIITAGDLTLSGGNLNTGNIALTIGDATTDTITLTTDGTGNGEVVLPNDSIGPNEILSTGQTDEYCLTYEGTGTTWEWQSCAAAGGGSWSALTVPTANLSLAHAGYTTAFTFDSVTTADAFALSSSSLTTGTVLDLSSTSTAGGASGLSKVLDIARSGTNTNASHTAYGLYSAVTNTGTTSTNVGGYFSASGATNNYGLLVANGNVGIGTTTPNAKLKVLDSSTRAPSLTYDAISSWEFGAASISLVGSVDTGAPWAVWLQARDNASGSTAYPISLNPLGGNVGIGTTAPTTALQIGTAAETHTLDTGDVLISSDLEVDGVLYLDGGTISNSAGTASLVLSATPTTTANSLSAGNWLIENTANVGQAALIVNQTKSSDLFTASASGTTKFTIANTGAITSAIGSWTSQVADSSTAIGFTFNTSNTLSTQGSKLLSFQNLGTEKMYLDKDGNLYVSGTVVSGNGTSMLLTNKSGGTVASKAIVVLDTSNNTSFTTTTTPYNKAGFGVVIGVGLGVANDADGDGVCDANDICMVAYGGSVNVTVKNATTAVKGDYLFTSDTAGSAVASAKQYDGLVGVVDDTTNAASGYLKMIFKVQPQVTAAAAIDKTTKHNEYWLYADQYQAVGEGANTDTNLLVRGLTFDNFTDTTKVDSTNTTASLDTNTQRTGLIGGQTMATSTTDNDGQTYLGSNTVNDQYYYDRTKDSSPQVQVELGIDPNWYNGVTLSVATSSASFSQNSVIASGAKQSNPNLSTSYNGSLVKVTGTDSTPRTIYITIKSPTTFDWTNYQGDAATGVTITPGTAQTLGTTGVSATFTNARYNTGDVFKIASWFIEAESATRGAKQQFPERSNVIATASSVDIIDADTQKLWMRFSQGTNYAIGVDANNDPSSANMLNGKAYISTNGSAATGLYTLDFAHDAVFKQNATDYRLSDTALYGRNGTNTYNVINTSNILVNSTVNDVSAAVIPNLPAQAGQPTQTVTVSGWGYLYSAAGAGVTETVNLPYKFNNTPSIQINSSGFSTAAPNSLAGCNNNSNNFQITSYNNSATSFVAHGQSNGGGISGNYYFCYTWTATGTVSPKQFVAAATNGGTTVINETDQSKIDIYYDGSWNKVTQVALTNKDLYYTINNATNYQLATKYGIGGYTTNQTGGNYSDKEFHYSTIPAANTSYTVAPTSLSVTQGTSTIDGKSNTIFVGYSNLLAVLQEKQNGGTDNDSDGETGSSVKYYTKDYISEEMVGDIRGMWPLNASNTASDLEDVSVKANVLTATNITSADAVSGVRNEATDFDGTTEYLSCTDAACGGTSKLDPGTSSFTFGSWFKSNGVVATHSLILHKGGGGGGQGWSLGTDNNGLLKADIRDVATEVHSDSPSRVDDSLWHFGVGVINKSTNLLDLYLDGKLVTSTSISAVGSIDSASDFNIGTYTNTGAAQWFFKGTIDEPFVTATALTAGQIKNMYQVGYRALQSHATTLGGGAADTNQQLGFISTGTNTVGDARPDWNNQFMYVGTNSTTLGAVSKIDLNSDTNIKTYNSSANVPTGGPLLIDEDTKSLAVGYNLEAVGSATGGVKTMGVDNNATATSGNFIGKTITTAESFNQAYLWAQYVLDSNDASNTIQVWASNDGGSNYSQCNLTNTDTSRSPSEYEYFCQFNTAGSSLKTKFVMARGSTKTNTWVSKYGIAWIDSNAIAGSANGSGLFTGTNASVANGSYIDVAHNQNSNDVLTNGWVYNTATSKWEQLDVKSPPSFTGTGADGNVSITSSTNMNTQAIANARYYADGIAYKIDMTQASGNLPYTGNTAILTSDTPSGLNSGDEILLINLQGATGDTADVGKYEFLKISSISTKTITFTTAIVNSYKGTTATNQKVVIQRVPQYTNVTLSGSGSLTASAWDGLVTTPTGAAGYLTGIVAFRTTGTVNVGSGTSITTNNLGFQGGTGSSSSSNPPGGSTYNGIAGAGAFSGNGGTGQGGGGGGAAGATSGGAGAVGGGGGGGGVTYGGGGGGGGYGTVGTGGTGGTNGTTGATGSSGSGTSGGAGGNGAGGGGGGGGGGTYGTAALSTIFFGSGGGSGGYGNIGGTGGRGGGVIFVSASTITNSGTISANGQNGTFAGDANSAGGGGGGGGSVFLAGSTLSLGTSTVTASAGNGVAGGASGGTGGNGGTGRIRVEYTDTISGTSSPTASTATTISTAVYSTTASPYFIQQTNANTVRLYNYSGSAQDLRLDVITGGLGRNAGTVSLAPAAADVDSQTSTNSIWINKTGSGGSLLKLQQSGTDVLNLSSTALTLTGNFLPGTDNTYSLGATSSARFKDLYLGPASLHIQSKSTDSGYPTLGLDYALGINTAGSLVTSLNGTSNALMTITQGGNVGIGTTAPGYKLDVNGDVNIPTNSFVGSIASYSNIQFGGDMVFRTAGSSTKMVLTSGGNVGIGTTGPSELLSLDNATYHNPKIAFGATGATAVIGLGGNYLGTGSATDGMLVLRNDAGTGILFGFNGSEKMRITSGGNVGIGTTAPGYKLDIQGTNPGFNVQTSSNTDYILNRFSNYNGGAGNTTAFGVENNVGGAIFTGSLPYASVFGNNKAVPLQLFTNDAARLTIKSDGNVGIGTTGPGYKLTVNSSTPGCNGCTAWTNYSDSRLKENIVNLSGDILDKIMNLKPVTFNYNDAYYSQTGYTQPDGQRPTFTGFIAQDLQQIFPEMVSTASSGYLDTNLSNLQIYLVKGIQQQQGQIASLSGQLASLLQIDGSCVTGDTMLPIRRKKKRRNSDDEQDEYDDLLCRIDDILPDDEVLSLNETTGSLDYSKINKLMDMGIKEVYELVTKSGKVIRTTANHPYLTLTEDGPIISKGKINI